MPPLRILHLDSLDALRANAEAWDDLWRRSDATLPSLRAEMLAQWVECFAQPADFHAVAIEAEGRLTAALPLVRRKVAGLLNAGAMPCNEWSASGDLLLDPAFCNSHGVPLLGTGNARASGSVRHCFCEAVAHETSNDVLDSLATAIRELPWPLLWLDEAVLDAPRWQALQAALLRAGMTVGQHPRWQVGRVEIDHDWPAYRARWSRKHRQKMASSLRQLTARGEVRLAVHSQFAPADVAATMRTCFEIEDCGWKGVAGTSILRTPGMAAMFIRQAELAAQCGQLELALLHCGVRPVAFCCGLSAKGVFHSIKTGYDPEFARQSPGQLLRYCLLGQFFAEPERQAMDFQGLMSEAHAAWLPRCYTVGRLAIATRGLSSRMAVWAYRDLWLRKKLS